jgi:hypothetical protein
MHYTFLLPLLAQIDSFSRSGGAKGGGSLVDVGNLGAIASGMAIGVLIVWCYSRRRTPTKAAAVHSPQRLFGELCTVHRLNAAQRRLLEWVADDSPLMQPALVFLDPLLLESAIARSESPGVRKRLTDLRARLFAGAAPTTS